MAANVTSSRNNTSNVVGSFGKPRRKKLVEIVDVLAVVAAVVCFSVSIITVSPTTSTPYRLGLKRQLQIIGLTLNGMNQCLKRIYPRLFLSLEARFGKSSLQNYDAILRSSILSSHTDYLWRAVLAALILMPTGLSVAYKEFIQGSSSLKLHNTGGFYGLTAPGQVASAGHPEGPSVMVNATLPFILDSTDTTPPPFGELPKAYGFNMLLLSNTSAAFLDAPMPDYVSSIQSGLESGESQLVSAEVRATITTYNKSVERHREDTDFWDYYLNDQSDSTGGLSNTDLYNHHGLRFLINNFGDGVDASWCFLAVTPEGTNNDENTAYFIAQSLMFNTRRDLCHGTWSVTNEYIQLVDGRCDLPPLAYEDQYIITNNTLAFTNFYPALLTEYLGKFATTRNQSEWRVPVFTGVTAAMYWSRITTLNGYYVGVSKPIDYANKNPHYFTKTVYYHVMDEIVSIKPTMNASWALYLILVSQPCLVVICFLAGLFFYRTPIGRGFGIIAILAGVRHESLELLKGASLSGQVKKPVRLKIELNDSTESGGNGVTPEISYIVGGEGRNASLPPTLRPRMPFTGSKHTGGAAEAFGSRRRVHGGTQYEMLSRS